MSGDDQEAQRGASAVDFARDSFLVFRDAFQKGSEIDA